MCLGGWENRAAATQGGEHHLDTAGGCATEGVRELGEGEQRRAVMGRAGIGGKGKAEHTNHAGTKAEDRRRSAHATRGD